MKYVYKIISALCSLGVLPLIVFLPYIHYYFSSTALQTLFSLGQLLQSETLMNSMEKFGLEAAPTGIADFVSLHDLAELALRFSGNSISSTFVEGVEVMIPSFFATCAAILLTCGCAILTAIFAFVCKDNRKVIAVSFAGIGFSLMVPMLIENTVSPLLTGTITLSNFIDSSWAGLLAEVEEITITSDYYFIPVLFAAVALWTVLYNATLPEKEKEARKKLIG